MPLVYGVIPLVDAKIRCHGGDRGSEAVFPALRNDEEGETINVEIETETCETLNFQQPETTAAGMTDTKPRDM